MTIEAIQSIQSPLGVEKTHLVELTNITSSQETNGPNFIGLLEGIDSHIKAADQLATSFIRGDDIPAHDIVIAMGKARTEMQLMVEVRNKLLEAYQEISRIQV